MTTPSFKDFFPSEVAALVTDRSVDFSFGHELPFDQRQRAFLDAHIGKRPVINVRQVHGDKVIVAEKHDDNAIMGEADGIVTGQKDLAIAVRTADCLSIFLYDPAREAVGVVHAGWRGTQRRIVQKAILAMQEHFGTQAKDVLAAFGPRICGKCYQVGEEFKKIFPDEIYCKDGRYYFDLLKSNKDQLVSAGVREGNVLDSHTCTYEDQKCFSYRRDGENTGRMLSLMMLKS